MWCRCCHVEDRYVTNGLAVGDLPERSIVYTILSRQAFVTGKFLNAKTEGLVEKRHHRLKVQFTELTSI
jgi:hypothetical protein